MKALCLSLCLCLSLSLSLSVSFSLSLSLFVSLYLCFSLSLSVCLSLSLSLCLSVSISVSVSLPPSCECRISCPFGLLYADDLVIISDNLEDLKIQLRACIISLDTRGLRINVDKTNLLGSSGEAQANKKC